MEQDIQDATKDKDVKVASIGSFHLCSPLPPSIVCPIMCKPTYESVEEIDDVQFEALDDSHIDISVPSSIADTHQTFMCKHLYESAKVCNFKRINKRTNTLKNWKWDEVIHIDSETEDLEEDVTPVIKRAKHACVVESNADLCKSAEGLKNKKGSHVYSLLNDNLEDMLGRNRKVLSGVL